MKKLATAIILVLIVFRSGAFPAEDRGDKKGPLPETTDIHYTGKYCNECHLAIPVKGGDKLLKFGNDFIRSCRCHGYTPGAYIHPVDIIPSKEKRARIPPV